MNDIIKRNLIVYIQHFPGNFVGFFELISDILLELGTDWSNYGGEIPKKWGDVFTKAAISIKKISFDLDEISKEHSESIIEKENKDPIALIKNFKDKILKEIKVIKD